MDNRFSRYRDGDGFGRKILSHIQTNEETNESVILDFPNSFTFDQLQCLAWDLLPTFSPFYFSPNGKGNLRPSSPNKSLHSLGARTGDVIFYSPDPHAFLRQYQTLGSSSSSVAQETPNSGIGDKTLMDIDKGEEISDTAGCAVIEPSLWKRVLKEELPNGVCEGELLIAGVHAVLVESGLVSFDPVSGKRVNLFRLPNDKLPSSLSYTVPALLADRPAKIVSVLLRFQDMGPVIRVYGSLAKEGRVVHKLSLDKNLFASALNLVRENRLVKNNDGLEFWKMVKDELALPFLIDICEMAGLSLPPCFQLLPIELKFKILELVGGVDLARCACVCSELRQVASNNALWKQKYDEEFGDLSDTGITIDWRTRFTSRWNARRRLIMAPPFAPLRGGFNQHPPPSNWYPIFRRTPPVSIFRRTQPGPGPFVPDHFRSHYEQYHYEQYHYEQYPENSLSLTNLPHVYPHLGYL